MIQGTIYKITCLVNGKCYIGQTYQPIQQRWNDHIRGQGSKALYKAIQKHGLEMFKFKVLHKEIACREVLNILEISLIAAHNAYPEGYNEHRGGQDEFRYSEAWEHAHEICRLYTEERAPLRQLAERFDTSTPTIQAVLKVKGVERRIKSDAWKHAQEIYSLYVNQSKTSYEIADIYNTSDKTIIRILKSYGMEIRGSKHRKHKTWQYESEICYLYTVEMKSLERIAKQFNTNPMQIRRILKANDIEFRKYSPRKRAVNEQLTLDFEMP